MRPEKAYAAEEITQLVGGASSLILTGFQGLDSVRMNLLRGIVREKSGRYFVVKNRIFGIGARERGLDALCDFLKGQVGVVFGENDPLDLLRAVVKFGKENGELQILGGLFEGEVRSAAEMVAIAGMPPREVAQQELVGMLGSLFSQMVHVLGEPLTSFVFVLGSIREKKDSSVSKEANSSG